MSLLLVLIVASSDRRKIAKTSQRNARCSVRLISKTRLMTPSYLLFAKLELCFTAWKLFFFEKKPVTSRLREVGPLSLSLSCVTRKKTARKKLLCEILGATNALFFWFIYGHALRTNRWKGYS